MPLTYSGKLLSTVNIIQFAAGLVIVFECNWIADWGMLFSVFFLLANHDSVVQFLFFSCELFGWTQPRYFNTRLSAEVTSTLDQCCQIDILM